MNRATEVAAVLTVLDTQGPKRIGDLQEELAAALGDRGKVELAIAAAWSEGLVGLDVEDRLVPL